MITRRQRRQARAMHAGGAQDSDIARVLHVSKQTARRICQEEPVASPNEPVRCRGCGALLAVTPCLACSLNRRPREQRTPSKYVSDREQERLDTPVAQIVGARTANYLEEVGIRTVHQLLLNDRQTLLAIPGFGPKALEEVFRGLARIGFRRGSVATINGQSNHFSAAHN